LGAATPTSSSPSPPAARNDLAAFADLKDGLERVLGRSVDLVEREAVERAILKEARTVYG
jgi:predicted nucleotidyltransferase